MCEPMPLPSYLVLRDGRSTAIIRTRALGLSLSLVRSLASVVSMHTPIILLSHVAVVIMPGESPEKASSACLGS